MQAAQYIQEALYIGGQWVKPAASAVLEVRSPATEEIIGRAPSCSPADIDRAVQAARAAFEGPASAWARTTVTERIAYLRAFGAALKKRRQQLAEVTSDEGGQPLAKNCVYQVDKALSIIDYYAQLGETYPFEERRQGYDNPFIVRKEPIGVVGLIMPWNAPLAISFFPLAPALLAGCTVVLKPSPETPLHAYVLAQACEEAGLPPGVVNIVPADREASEALVTHPGVDKIAFTGSTATGRRIASLCGERLKRYSLELGGKSAAIILEDVDLHKAMPMIVRTATMNSCEACVGQTRTLVPRSRYAEIVEAFVSGVARLKMGDPRHPDTDMGPLIAERQRTRVESYIKAGREEGARLMLGGGRPAHLTRGWYVEPTVFADVGNHMRIAREEIFGPVLSLIPYNDETDAIAIANDSTYGLSGTVWTSDPKRGVEVARRVRTGNYGVNLFNLDIAAPFGGFKESGIGRQLGPEGLDGFFETKAIQLSPADVAAGKL
ncbi:aldehyde dehydrogenase [Azoarcus sp. DN11]|uniref:aldehyde dehydrogenase n=1 Tax=Azoarcus sp. DN11 TaxID=356837 RepID=UPI000EADBC49|nr:aldehyde dehydrogenase [Azoarcus sp. DN11]AYH43540.1 aldehyde dehydrogenase [Azoarcus sp. DN11]